MAPYVTINTITCFKPGESVVTSVNSNPGAHQVPRRQDIADAPFKTCLAVKETQWKSEYTKIDLIRGVNGLNIKVQSLSLIPKPHFQTYIVSCG